MQNQRLVQQHLKLLNAPLRQVFPGQLYAVPVQTPQSYAILSVQLGAPEDEKVGPTFLGHASGSGFIISWRVR